MQIGIFSDCHCGFKFGEERGEDSFICLEEAMDKCSDCDLILMAGDIFDNRIPKQEVFAKTAKLLSKAQHVPSRTTLVELKNKDVADVSPLAIRGTPIVAIHGTHERRSKYLTNPIQVLEHAGLLIHLNCSTAVFEIDDKKVAVHGMSGVLEQYAKEILDDWNPQPIPDAINIFMFHQSVSPYIYSPLDPPTLKLSDLPKGFDLYVLGHIHWHEISNLHEGKLLVTGSTTPTNVHKIESEQQKVIFKYDGTLRSIPLEKQRKVLYKEFPLDSSIKERMINYLSTLSVENKPLIIMKVKGEITREAIVPNFNFLEEKFGKKAIINVVKDISMVGVDEQVDIIRRFREETLSPKEQGLKILNSKLLSSNVDLNIHDIFDVLIDGNVDLALKIITGEQKTLSGIND